MTTSRIQEWPPQLTRAVSSSFTLGSLSMAAQPLFSIKPAVFAEPLDQRWVATFQSPPLEGREKYIAGKLVVPSYREIEGRVAKLKGMGGLLRLPDPLYVRPQYDAALIETNWSGGRTWSGGRRWLAGLLPPFVTVDETAYAGATSIVVRGLPSSVSRVLRYGDRYEGRPGGRPQSFGSLYIATEDCRTNAAGKTRLYFEPGLRVGLNIGDQIVLRKPKTVFSPIDDKQGVVSRSGNVGAFGLSLIEVLPWDQL